MHILNVVTKKFALGIAASGFFATCLVALMILDS